MKHWDLLPKELVTLIGSHGVKITTQFLFRTTTLACFKGMETGKFRQFELLDDGNLCEIPTLGEIRQLVSELPAFSADAAAYFLKGERRKWFIAGADRNTRTEAI